MPSTVGVSEERKPYHLLQIDLLKGLAIIFVIILHSLPFNEVRIYTFSVFYVWQALPIFVAILALNQGMSFSRKKITTFNGLYSAKYVLNRVRRLVYPFLLIFFATLAVWITIDYYFLKVVSANLLGGLVIRVFSYFFVANWFVPFVFVFILIFPALYWLYLSNPKAVLVASFAVSLAAFLLELAIPELMYSSTLSAYLWRYAILRYLFLIVLGIWIIKDQTISSDRNKWIIRGACMSVVYLFALNVLFILILRAGAPPNINLLTSATQNCFTFFYTILLLLIGINYLPKVKKGLLSQTISFFGRASWHIFLFQAVYIHTVFYAAIIFLRYSFNVEQSFVLATIINVLICCFFGSLFFLLDAKFLDFSFVKSRFKKTF